MTSNNVVQFPTERGIESKKRSFFQGLHNLKSQDSSRVTAYINNNIVLIYPIDEFQIDVTFSRDLFQIYFIGSFPGSPLVVQSPCAKSGLYRGAEEILTLMEKKGKVMMAALRPVYTDPLPMFAV